MSTVKLWRFRLRQRFCHHVPELWMDDGDPLYICEKCGAELADPEEVAA